MKRRSITVTVPRWRLTEVLASLKQTIPSFGRCFLFFKFFPPLPLSLRLCASLQRESRYSLWQRSNAISLLVSSRRSRFLCNVIFARCIFVRVFSIARLLIELLLICPYCPVHGWIRRLRDLWRGNYKFSCFRHRSKDDASLKNKDRRLHAGVLETITTV